MIENDWFIHKLSVLQDDYLRRDKENHKMLAASYEGRAKEKEKYEGVIRELCRALERAQEIIVEIGEKSGNKELLKDAKVYANVIGGLVTGMEVKAAPHYSTGPEKAKKKTTAPAKKRKK